MAALQFIYYKLISRILSPFDNGWLSFIWLLHYCNNLAAYPSASGEQPSNADIRGIAVHKVYPLLQLLPTIVSFYLTFSPLSPQYCGDGYFLWHYLPGKNRDRLLTGVLLYTVRTFLPCVNKSDNLACSNPEDKKLCIKGQLGEVRFML